MIRRSVLALVLGVAAVACTSTADDAGTVTGAVGKGGSDGDALTDAIKLGKTQYLGKISNGEERRADYTASPSYQSYGFEAKGGDDVTAYVASEDGDPKAWITDEQFNVLAFNDDAETGSLDAKVHYHVPEGEPSSAYRLVFRDLKFERHAFTARLEIAVAAGVCQYAGQAYNPGDSFDSVDGCNSCSCVLGPFGGTVSCTGRVCDCDPGNEPWHTYLGTPAQCIQLLYNCPAGESHFANTCGCGCARPH